MNFPISLTRTYKPKHGQILDNDPVTTTPVAISINDLPWSLRNIAQVIGPQAAIQLASHAPFKAYKLRRGQSLYVLKRFPDSHWIIAAIGRFKADQLSAAYGGEHIQLAVQFRKAQENLRASQVFAMWSAGTASSAIAKAMSMPLRTVYSIVKRKRTALMTSRANVSARANVVSLRSGYRPLQGVVPTPGIGSSSDLGSAGGRNLS